MGMKAVAPSDLSRQLAYDYLRNVHPSQWRYFPRRLMIFGRQPFTQITSSSELKSILRKWRLKIRDQLTAELPRLLGDENNDTMRTRLNLACSIFFCKFCFNPGKLTRNIGASLVGLDGVHTHICTTYTDCPKAGFNIKFSLEGHQTARDLLALSQLDPLTTTARDMDALDARFLCKNCDSSRPRYRQALTWRECVRRVVTRCKIYQISPTSLT